MYFLKCSVCEGEFNSKEKWTCHLTDQSHLIKARKKCVRWSQKRRSHALVVYSTFSLSSSLGLTLLQKLSKDLLTFVTDFVWREGNSRLGVIQFESSDRLDKVMTTLGNPKSLRTEVDGYPVMFRRAIDLVDLEWETLVSPELEEAESFSDRGMTMTQEELVDEVEKPKKQRKKVFSEPDEAQESEAVVSSSTTLAVRKECLKESDQSLNTSGTTSNCLHEQFSSLLETVRIPDSEFNVILGIIKDVEAAFSSFSKSQNTTVRVVMLKNWYLQLRNSTDNHLQLFVYREDDSSTDVIKWTTLTSDELFEQLKKVDCFGRPEEKSFTDPKNPTLGQIFTHKESGIQFVIVLHAPMMVDAQRCQLLNYYLTFDTRIKSLIALTYLWARINSVRISRCNILAWDFHRQIPDPGPLEWLLVVFLSKEGIIPIVRQIQQDLRRLHFCLETGHVHVGFCEDKGYAALWSGKVEKPAGGTDEFALSVLQLAGKFFLFCTSLNSKPCVINTKDGEVLPRSFFRLRVTKRRRKPSVTKYSSTKLDTVGVEWLREDLNSPKFHEIKRHIIMLHPFNIRWRFAIDSAHFRCNVCPMMKTAGKKLNQFFNRMKRMAVNSKKKQVLGQGNNFDLEGLLNCNL